MIVPLPHGLKKRRRDRKQTEADDEAFRRAAGAWRGPVDADILIDDSCGSRHTSESPYPDLSSRKSSRPIRRSVALSPFVSMKTWIL